MSDVKFQIDSLDSALDSVKLYYCVLCVKTPRRMGILYKKHKEFKGLEHKKGPDLWSDP